MKSQDKPVGNHQPQIPLNPTHTEKLDAFLNNQAYIMRQLNAMFDVLMQGQESMEIDLSSYASIGWDITNQSIDDLRDIASTAQALKATKSGAKASTNAAVDTAPQEQITIPRHEMDDLLYTLNGASAAFDQLHTLLRLIQQTSVDNDVQNLATLGRESTVMWSNNCDLSEEEFKHKYGLNEQGGK